MVSSHTLDSLMATLAETQRLAHDRAHSIERLEREKAALLEALERLATQIGGDWPMIPGYRAELWDKARAAIAQAKGEAK